MKGTLPIATAIVVAALTIGAPTALAEGRLAGSPETTQATTPDWFERAVAASLRNDAVTTPSVDAFERADVPAAAQTVAPVAASGSTIAWSQIGIAFGIGLLLALGLVAAMRLRPSRPIAQ